VTQPAEEPHADAVNRLLASIAEGILFFGRLLGSALIVAAAALPADGSELPAAAAGPRFRADGPNAEAYGRSEGYPRCEGLRYVREDRCKVGALSHFDLLFPARTIAASSAPTPFRRATSEPVVRYNFAGEERTLEQYLERRPVTGFLVARGDTILIERYQYGRTDKHRLTSFSMAKTIVGLLVGIAVEEGAIRSIDDPARVYVPALRGTAYGATPIKALLQMRSGVRFKEDYADHASDIYTLARLTLEQDPGGSIDAVKRFDFRLAAPGKAFSYSSADTVVLGLVVAGATGRTLSDYAREKLWQPLGTEAEASWIVDAKGHEVTFAYFNAVLRDWARLGLMLANHGVWAKRSIVPRQWLAASIANSSETEAMTRYGYHVWLSADSRRFVLQGLRGQFVLADPESGLVLVQTALSSEDFLNAELSALWTAARAQLR
jgi:CubicO group peptidase (beta-lactamase class C family)